MCGRFCLNTALSLPNVMPAACSWPPLRDPALMFACVCVCAATARFPFTFGGEEDMGWESMEDIWADSDA